MSSNVITPNVGLNVIKIFLIIYVTDITVGWQDWFRRWVRGIRGKWVREYLHEYEVYHVSDRLWCGWDWDRWGGGFGWALLWGEGAGSMSSDGDYLNRSSMTFTPVLMPPFAASFPTLISTYITPAKKMMYRMKANMVISLFLFYIII